LDEEEKEKEETGGTAHGSGGSNSLALPQLGAIDNVSLPDDAGGADPPGTNNPMFAARGGARVHVDNL
jgi:hypothetical protein